MGKRVIVFSSVTSMFPVLLHSLARNETPTDAIFNTDGIILHDNGVRLVFNVPSLISLELFPPIAAYMI